MSKPITFTPVEPIGYRDTTAFVDRRSGGSVEQVRDPIYPLSRGRELRMARIAAMLSLRKAAARARVSMTDWSGVEQGRLEPSDWAPLFAAIQEPHP